MTCVHRHGTGWGILRHAPAAPRARSPRAGSAPLLADEPAQLLQGRKSRRSPWGRARRGFSPGSTVRGAPGCRQPVSRSPSPSSRVTCWCILVRGRARSPPSHGGSSRSFGVYRAIFGVWLTLFEHWGLCTASSMLTDELGGEMEARAEPAQGRWLRRLCRRCPVQARARGELSTEPWHSQRVGNGHRSPSGSQPLVAPGCTPHCTLTPVCLHPNATQRWASGERGQFSPWCERGVEWGTRDGAGIPHPTATLGCPCSSLSPVPFSPPP